MNDDDQVSGAILKAIFVLGVMLLVYIFQLAMAQECVERGGSPVTTIFGHPNGMCVEGTRDEH